MRTTLCAAILGTMLLTLGLAAGAAADSIYLKNGRVIRSDDVSIDGERLVFFQFGGYQTIPMELVDRVEKDGWVAPGSPGRRPLPGADQPAPENPAAAAPAAPTGDSAAALQALAGMMGDGGGGIDASQALQLLQGLGAQQGAGAGGGMEALAPLLGMLGGTTGGGLGGGLGDIAGDLGAIQTVLPALTRLGAALFAPEYSASATEAAARELISSLEALGVSPAEIRARAAQMGVPADILDKIRKR